MLTAELIRRQDGQRQVFRLIGYQFGNPVSQKASLDAKGHRHGPAAPQAAHEGEAMEASNIQGDAEFSPAEWEVVYKCIFNCRDVRGQFLPKAIPDDALVRIRRSAYHSPSVRLMQPWDFMVDSDLVAKRKVRDAFQAVCTKAAEMFNDDRQRT